MYQFWQAERKDEVNASGDKITGETLPAVTQLFTEHYMVLFLLHNTIGAWWATKIINSRKEAQKTQKGGTGKIPTGIVAATEEEARAAVALPGYEFTYLRFIRDEPPPQENGHKEAQEAQEREPKESPFEPAVPSCGQSDPSHSHKEAQNSQKKNESSLFKSFVPSCGNSESSPPSCGQSESVSWRPAAGSFPGWPKTLKDFKLLDPCCGSGHFLVAAFVLLVLMRMQEERLSAKDACDAVLRENLHGLELDPRCTQIAAFALALAAWKFPNLPAPQEGGNSHKEGREGGDGHKKAQRTQKGEQAVLFESFVPSCGQSSAGEKDIGHSHKEAQKAQEGERRLFFESFVRFCGNSGSCEPLGFRPLPPLNIACSGLGVNARKEDWLALANGDTRLRSGLEQLYDLFQKAPELGSLINPRRLAHGDLVTASFAEIQPLLTRALQSEKAKRNDDLNEIGVAAQGMTKAASILACEFALAVTNVPYLGNRKQGDVLKEFCRIHHGDAKADLATCFVERCLASCTDAGTVAVLTPQNWLFQDSYKHLRARLLQTRCWNFVAQMGEHGFESSQAAGAFTAMVAITQSPTNKFDAFLGLDVTTQPTPEQKETALRLGEVRPLNQLQQFKNPDSRITFDSLGSAQLLEKLAIAPQGIITGDLDKWQRCFWELASLAQHWKPFLSATTSTQPFAGREFVVDWSTSGVGMIRPRPGNLALAKSGVAISQMRSLCATLYCGELYDGNVAPVVPTKPTMLPALWSFCSSPEFTETIRAIDRKVNITNGTLLKLPFDLAHWQRVAAERYPNGLPEPSSNDSTQWLFAGHPVDSTAPLQVGVARLLGYRWPRQIGQTVSGAAPVADDGLEKLADEDGIVCIPSVRGEPPAAERLRALLAAAYGDAWSSSKQDELLSTINPQPSTIEDWLRNGFFDQHNKLFHQRPFIWQIWDGRKDGFSALVNYHKLDHKLLEKLTYTYLGDWIKKQQEAVANEESGADLSASDGQAGDRLLKAQQLQGKLKLILEGEAPYDIFVRWKPLEQQPIGWHPDLNDGVRLNIRPFMEADLSACGAQAGVLRKRPNIKWGKDRGKNPPGSPWGEERDNDRHLTLAEKRAARKAP